MRILLIEDDPRSLFALQSVLQSRGYDVAGYATAEEADRCNGHPYDAAIIDIRLPGEQGPDYARRLLAQHPDTRILFVTAYDSIPPLNTPIPGSVVLIKPIDVDLLTRLL
ncbi:MAG TPA: response regulator [Phycisphaerae bacterium]|nr:response regulator [Phycisphaerae bacterium]